MRSAVRTALVLTLALAPALAAHADPFDGSENGGVGCVGKIFTLGTSSDHYGVVSGGPYLVADVLRNDDGFVGVDTVKGASDLRMTCSIRGVSGSEVATVTTEAPAGTVVVMAPRVVAFTTPYYSSFEVCTTFAWTNNRGGGETANAGCLPA